jgi:hypothetical protein
MEELERNTVALVVRICSRGEEEGKLIGERKCGGDE